MKVRITAPDGAKYVITAPEGASDEEILAYAQSQFGKSAANEQPEALPPALDLGENYASAPKWTGPVDVDQGGKYDSDELLSKYIPGTDTARQMAMGAADIPMAAAQIGAHLVGQGDAIDQKINQAEAEYQKRRTAGGGSGVDVARLAGNVAMGGLLTAAGAPVAAAIPQRVGAITRGILGGGAAGGLTSPVVDSDDFAKTKMQQIRLGAFGGAAAGAAAKALSPTANLFATKLRERGVKSMTPGQQAGGAWQAAEEKIASQGLLTGPAMRYARQKANREFNEAAINEALRPVHVGVLGSSKGAANRSAPVLQKAKPTSTELVVPGVKESKGLVPFSRGKALVSALRGKKPGPLKPAEIESALENFKIPPVGRVKGYGHEAVDEAHRKLGGLYEKILRAAGDVTITPRAKAQIAALDPLFSEMDANVAGRVRAVLDNKLYSRLGESESIDAKLFKTIDSELGAAVRQFAREGHSQAASHLRKAREVLHDELYKQDPYLGKWLKKTDAAYANMIRVEEAAARAIHSKGEFTPGQLVSAVKRRDTSLRKGQTSRGKAPMQKFAQESEETLGNYIPETPAEKAISTLSRTGQLVGALHPAGLWNIAVQAPVAASYLMPGARRAVADQLRKRGALASGIAAGNALE